MTSEVIDIGSITPESKRWTAKVCILEKSSPKTAAQTSNKYQKLILGDNKGVCVQATIFEQDIEYFKETLLPFQFYYISNATVKRIQEQHRLINNAYQCTISSKTPIREVPKEELDNEVIPNHFNVVPISELANYMTSQTQIDIMAAAIDIYPPKTKGSSILQEVLLLNEEIQPVMLTLWNEFVTNEGAQIAEMLQSYPVLLATRLRVTTFNGISLSTRSSTTFTYNPPTTKGIELQKWVRENKGIIKNVIHTKIVALETSSSQQTTDVTPIVALTDIDKSTSVWVKATATIRDTTQRLWYMCCETCLRGINADYGQKFHCWPCKREQTAKPRCRFTVEISDETGSTLGIVFGNKAEKIIQTTAQKLMESTDEAGHTDSAAIKATTNLKQLYYLLKPSKIRGVPYTVESIQEELGEQLTGRKRTR